MEDTISILRGIKEKYELHHGVRISDSALVSAATLSNRYITDRFLPDKAIDLMDEAASRSAHGGRQQSPRNWTRWTATSCKSRSKRGAEEGDDEASQGPA